jgi:hypothetical protein
VSYTPFLHPDFERELTDAAVWYEDTLQGLGIDFTMSVKQGLHLIERNPFLFPVVYKNYRRFLVKKFPYKVYYELVGEVLVVYALVHHKKDTHSGRKRLLKRKQ